jgi:uncharacterized caspase-like protein
MAWLRLVSVLFFAVWSSVATAETRLALVVGNAAYSHVPALANPINDASDIANALRHLGFQVITALNTDRLALERAIRQFSQRLSEAKADETVALFFYAGHGIEVADRNFLIPIDAELKQEIDLDLQTVPVDLVLHQIETRARVGLVFLDACRDNPFMGVE